MAAKFNLGAPPETLKQGTDVAVNIHFVIQRVILCYGTLGIIFC
jgi:hypothetical protein